MEKDDLLNKFIHEKVFGECWHEWDDIKTEWPEYHCKICTKVLNLRKAKGNADLGVMMRELTTPDYTSPEMFITIWEKVKGEDWFRKGFIPYVFESYSEGLSEYTISDAHIYAIFDIVNPQRLCELIRDFLIEKEEEK